MSSVKVNFTYVHSNTAVRYLKPLDKTYGIAFNPLVDCTKHKRKWVGLAICDSKVAKALSLYFEQMAKNLEAVGR